MATQNSNMKNNTFQRFINSFRGYKKHFALFLMFLPAIITIFIFHYVPMYGITMAFKDYKVSKGILGSDWIGFEHFNTLFSGRSFGRALRNTIIISLEKMVVCFPAPIILALLINEVKNLKFKKVVQTISYLPHFLSWVVLAGMFTQMLSPSYGVINGILKSLGMEPIFFLGDKDWFRTVLVTTAVWQGVGWGTIIYLAAMSGINPELYESAECDGAKRYQKMFYITLPQISSVISFQLIMSCGRILNAGFDQVFNLYNQAVYETADILDTYIYRIGIAGMDFEMGTAAGLFKNVVGFGLVMITNTISKKIDGSGVW